MTTPSLPDNIGQFDKGYVILADSAGNVVKTVANGDGTTTLQTSGSGGGGSTTPAAPGYMRLEDGATQNLATVAAFHNADQQSLPASSYGLNVGGVAQLLNGLGSLDRVRGTGWDNVSALGITTGSQQNAMQFYTTTSTATTASAAGSTFTPTNINGTVRGVPWAIQTGMVLTVDTGGNSELITVTAVLGNTFTAATKKSHAAGVYLSGFVYNQQRDATLSDGASPSGVNASATYFWNQALNSGVGGLEIGRSAAGEPSGSTGIGMNVAAEYEYNSGGPVLASGYTSGFAFDRAINLQGKGTYSGNITSTSVGNTSIIFAAANATARILPGAQIALSGGVFTETVYVSSTWVPGSSATVPLVNPVTIAGQNSFMVSAFSPNGPGISGFTPEGIAIEEEALWDPVSQLYYIERSATQDGVSAQNVVMESPALWNGSTMDRKKSLQGLYSGPSNNTISGVSGRQSSHPGLPVFSGQITNGVGSSAVLDTVTCHNTYTYVINQQGTPTSASVILQGSLDNAYWYNIGNPITIITASAVSTGTGTPSRYWRFTASQSGGGPSASSTTYYLGFAN